MQEVDVDEPLGDEEGQGEEEGAIGRSKLMSYQGEERRMGRKMRARKRRGEGGGGYGATVKTNKTTGGVVLPGGRVTTEVTNKTTGIVA